MTNNTNLAPLPFWQARSFWLALATAAQIVAPAFGWRIETPPDTLASVAVELLPLVTAGWAYLERRAPSRRLVLL
jgi:hypothetical protein